jgi:hypothetical protein
MGTLEPKNFRYLRCRAELSGDESITCRRRTRPAPWARCWCCGPDREAERFKVGARSEWVSIRFDLTPGSKLTGFTLYALPAQERYRTLQLPLILANSEKSRRGQVYGAPGWAQERFAALKQVESAGDEVDLKVPAWAMTRCGARSRRRRWCRPSAHRPWRGRPVRGCPDHVPDDDVSVEVQVALVSAFGAIGVAVVGLIGSRMAKHGRQIASGAANIEAVREQVQNSHKTNLRDDIDSLRDEMRQGFRLVHEAVHDVRVGLTWEARERQDLEQKLTGHRPLA